MAVGKWYFNTSRVTEITCIPSVHDEHEECLNSMLDAEHERRLMLLQDLSQMAPPPPPCETPSLRLRPAELSSIHVRLY